MTDDSLASAPWSWPLIGSHDHTFVLVTCLAPSTLCIMTSPQGPTVDSLLSRKTMHHVCIKIKTLNPRPIQTCQWEIFSSWWPTSCMKTCAGNLFDLKTIWCVFIYNCICLCANMHGARPAIVTFVLIITLQTLERVTLDALHQKPRHKTYNCCNIKAINQSDQIWFKVLCIKMDIILTIFTNHPLYIILIFETNFNK
jgi:hypothetical protein